MKSTLRSLLLPACTLLSFSLCSHAQADKRIIFQDDFEAVEIEEEPANWVIPERRPTRVPVRDNLDGAGKSMVFPLNSTLRHEPRGNIGTPVLFSNSQFVDIFLRFQLGGIPDAEPPLIHIAPTMDQAPDGRLLRPPAVTLKMDSRNGGLLNVLGQEDFEKIAELPPAQTWTELLIRLDFATGQMRFVLDGEEVEQVFAFRKAGAADETGFVVAFERLPNSDTLVLDQIRIAEADSDKFSKE